MKKKIKMGMLGGGPGSFIGPVHRMAASLDGLIELVCGCFSSNPEKSLQTGKELCLPENRIYTSYQEMIEKEAQLPAEERMDFLSIVTP
ncbi:MAG: gfo/Idh/MocA family oxidoreductase, partial [Bacteroidaceae bacterium]|nr:gfo/Idh/MocA family oxidoreductase [Bacteroidaceae bacterium]